MTDHPGQPAAESHRALLGGTTGALKVFPLPGIVLFPGAPAPFHVFEPRYRALVEDALSGDRLLAVPTLREPSGASAGRAPLHPVAGAGFIEADELLPDGRYNILVRGVARVRLLEELAGTGKPYREFRVEILDDVMPPAGQAVLEADVSALEQLVLELARRTPREAGERDLAEAVARMRVPGRVADAVAAALLDDAATRLAVLEELDVKRRIARVLDEVAAMLLSGDADASPAARA